MTVKEIILAAADELDVREEVELYLEGYVEMGDKQVTDLLRCFNAVENQLALEYLPLVTEEEIQTETGAVYYSDLSRAPVRIVKITDKWGNEAPFKIFAEYVKTEPGAIKVRYTYTPKEKSLSEQTDFTLAVSKRLFVYGIAAEYCLSSGLFEESAVWEKKYKEAISAVYKSRRGKGKILSRRWV